MVEGPQRLGSLPLLDGQPWVRYRWDRAARPGTGKRPLGSGVGFRRTFGRPRRGPPAIASNRSSERRTGMSEWRILLSAVAGFLVMSALSWLWHDPLMGDYYTSILGPATRQRPVTVAFASGYVILSALMGWVYPRYYRGGMHWMEGAKFGALMGILWVVPFQLVLFGAAQQSFAPIVIDGAWHVVEQGLGGVAIALVAAPALEEM